jgi:hypothetical protein
LGCEAVRVDEMTMRVERLDERLGMRIRRRANADIGTKGLGDGRRWERRGDTSRKRTGISRLFGQVVVIIRGPVRGYNVVPCIVSYNPNPISRKSQLCTCTTDSSRGMETDPCVQTN